MKKYLPPKQLVPAMLVLGAVGAIVATVVFPKASAWLANLAAKSPVKA